MTGAENIRHMQEYFEAFNRGDLETARSLWAENARFHMSGDNRFAGDYSGLDDVFDVIGQLNQAIRGLRMDLADALADERYMAIISHVHGTRDGEQIDLNYAAAYRIDEDGKFAELWFLADDQEESDRMLNA